MPATLTRLEESASTFRADRSAGVATPTVTATLANDRARLSSGPFNWESDLGLAVGGDNLAPSPTAYLLGALAACGVLFVRDTLAPQFGITLEDVAATASCRADAAGLLGIEGADPALQDVSLTIRVSSTDPKERVEAMFAAWRERCPIYLAITNPDPVALAFEVTATP